MSEPALVELRDVRKVYPGGTVAVERVDLRIERNEFFALLGPSGCGKTTLMRMIAGFEVPTEGRILIDGQDVTDLPPNRRPVNLVFQSYAVFPHMSVAANVGYGLAVTGVPRAEIAPRVEEALARVKLAGLGPRKPAQLSGGQRQRVALARALIKQPKLLLLDEPLSALDRKLREEMQHELVRLRDEVGITFLVVTHDQDEAMAMAGRIGVMQAGRIEQLGSPRDIYERPRTRFVADFIGDVSLLDGVAADWADGHQIVTLADGTPARVAHPASIVPGTPVSLAIRPERLRLLPVGVAPPEGLNAVGGTVLSLTYLGDTSFWRLRGPGGAVLEAGRLNLGHDSEADLGPGASVLAVWRAEDAVLFED